MPRDRKTDILDDIVALLIRCKKRLDPRNTYTNAERRILMAEINQMAQRIVKEPRHVR